MSLLDRARHWRPTPPPLPEDLARLVGPEDSEWFTRGLVPLRAGEADRPHFVDPTRPTTAVAAFPGGIVPDDVLDGAVLDSPRGG